MESDLKAIEHAIEMPPVPQFALRAGQDSNRIQIPSRIIKLRIQKTVRSPGSPRKRHGRHWSCHCKSLSRTSNAQPIANYYGRQQQSGRATFDRSSTLRVADRP